MSLNDYVHHMSQKYRLSVAIAVLKSKPENVSINDYINKLQEKLNSKMDVDNISVCSDDFKFDNDIIDEFNENFIDNCEKVNDFEISDDEMSSNYAEVNKSNENCTDKVENNTFSSLMEFLKDTQYDKPFQELSNIQDKYTQDSLFDASQSIINIDNIEMLQATNENHPNVDKMFPINTNIDDDKIKNNAMVMKVVRNIYRVANKQDDEQTKLVDFEKEIDNNIKTNEDFNAHTSKNNFDLSESDNMLFRNENNKGILVNVRKNVSKMLNGNIVKVNIEHNKDTNYPAPTKNTYMTNYLNDPTQNENIKTILENDRKNASKLLIGNTVKENIKNNKDTYYSAITKDTYTSKNSNDTTQYELSQNIGETEANINVKHINKENHMSKDNIATRNGQDNDITDTQATVIYTLPDYTNTHISQSQFEHIDIRNNFIYGNKTINLPNDIGNENIAKEKDSNIILNTEELFPQIENTEIGYLVNKHGQIYRGLHYQSIDTTKNNQEYVVNVIDTIPDNTRDLNNTFKITDENYNHQHIEANKTDYIIQECQTVLPIQEEINTEIPKLSENCDFEESLTDEDVEERDEVIPFKVIEELNKIKSYLNRKVEKTVEYSSDSGYRSDSQSRCSYKSVQLSDNWLNQSAHCLYMHITTCPLVESSQDITKEISQVLSILIDRLHEEEKYPQFLEELLDHINLLLDDVTSNSSENLLKKEECIQRLYLLNQSIHILKYTIDKITNILTKTHTQLTNQDLYEINNIEEVENLAYIFHILEILIPKYMKFKSNLNSTQTQSQEEKSLKRSSITDIWRKKWNPNYKEITNFEGRSEKCVLSKCSEVLNKIVVDCIEGYSLIAFAALQCFNMMQN